MKKWVKSLARPHLFPAKGTGRFQCGGWKSKYGVIKEKRECVGFLFVRESESERRIDNVVCVKV